MSAGETSVRRDFDDPNDPQTEVLLNIDNKQIESKKERGLRTGARVVAVFDGLAFVVILAAILIQLRNDDNWIFLMNLPHSFWWLFTIYLVGTTPSKIWYNLYIGLNAVWLALDVGSLIWRAILLHNCYDSSSSSSCRDFIIQLWFIISANGLLIITCIILIVLITLLRREVISDRKAAAEEEEECRKLREENARLRAKCATATTATQPPCKTSCPLKPTFEQTSQLTSSNPSGITIAGTTPDPTSQTSGGSQRDVGGSQFQFL